MSSAPHDENDRSQSLKFRVTRFLSSASQVAQIASAVISNQFCHNINPARTLSLSAAPRSQESTFTSSENQQPQPVPKETSVRPSENKVNVQPNAEFEAFLLCQGTRALEIATVEEYRQHYVGEMSWRREMGVDACGEDDPQFSENITTQTHSLFERSVENSKRIGTEEFKSCWLRFCDEHGSRGTYQTSHPSCEITLAPCESLRGKESTVGHTGLGSVENLGADRDSCRAILGPSQAMEPCQQTLSVPALSIQLNSVGNILEDVSSSSSQCSPFSQTAMSATSATYLGTPLSHAEFLPLSVSPSPEPLRPVTLYQENPMATPYLALYSPDHKLGFDCNCKDCQLKAIKKERPDSFLTLAERRQAKKSAQKTEIVSRPPTPEVNYAMSDAGALNPPCGPAAYFMSGNTMVPTNFYKDQLQSVAPSTWMLGGTIVYSVKSRDRSQSSRKRGRNMGTSCTVTEDEGTADEEHEDGRRKRRK